MFKDLVNSLFNTKQNHNDYTLGKLFLTCVCECADVLDALDKKINKSTKSDNADKVSYKIPYKNEKNKLINDIRHFKELSNKSDSSYVHNFFRDDYETDEEFTLLVRLTVNYPYSTRTDKEIQFNITGPNKAVALLRYYYIASTVERYIYENELRVWFHFNIMNIKDITRSDLINLYIQGMPDSQKDDKIIRQQLSRLFTLKCFTASIPVNQDQIVYNVAKTPWSWLLARHVKVNPTITKQ